MKQGFHLASKAELLIMKVKDMPKVNMLSLSASSERMSSANQDQYVS